MRLLSCVSCLAWLHVAADMRCLPCCRCLLLLLQLAGVPVFVTTLASVSGMLPPSPACRSNPLSAPCWRSLMTIWAPRCDQCANQVCAELSRPAGSRHLVLFAAQRLPRGWLRACALVPPCVPPTDACPLLPPTLPSAPCCPRSKSP